MRNALVLFAAVAFSGQAALAADIFVRQAQGANLDKSQVKEVTDQVKRAVGGMSEHSLVNSESQADFVLVPSVMSRGDELVLRIQKERDGQVIATSEEVIRSMGASSNNAQAATESALRDDMLADSESAMTATPEEMSDMSIAGERDIASSPTTDPSSTESSTFDQGSMGDQGSVSGTTASEDTMSGTTDTGDIAASDTGSGSGSGSGPASDVRAPSPMMQNPNRMGYFQAGIGPAFPLGMNSDRIMYSIDASYNYEFNQSMVGKIFGDFNLATGGDTARFINIGAAAEVYPVQMQVAGGVPYVLGSLGYAFTRQNETEEQRDGLAVGAGAGFKFAAAQTNLDVGLHYSILTAQVAGTNPPVLGLRLAVAF